MSPQLSANGPTVVAIVGVGILAWYLYQIASRKQERIRYKIRQIIVALVVYAMMAWTLIKQGLSPVEAVVVGVLVGMGSAWLLGRPPKEDRRIPKAVRRAVCDDPPWAASPTARPIPFQRVRPLRLLRQGKAPVLSGSRPSSRKQLTRR